MKKKVLLGRNVLAVLMGLFLSFVALLPAKAEEKPSADFSVSFLSAYIWRGFEFSKDSLVIQPSFTVSYKGFSANLWGNLDTDPYTPSRENDATNNWNETDLTLSYGRGFFDDFLSAEVGYIYYALDESDDSQECFVSLGLDTLLSPTLTVYKEFAHYPHWYILLGITHAFEITEWASLELAASGSYLYSQDKVGYPEVDNGEETGDEFTGFHDGLISASLPMTFGEYFTVTPTLAYTFPLSGDAGDQIEYFSFTGDDDSFLYGGVTCSFAF